MNKIILMGRLVRDPEVKYTQTGKVVAQFTMAVDRPFTNQDGQKEADFIPIVIWGKPAEVLGNSVTKGQRLLVEGRLQIRSYEAKDNSKRWVTEVIASSFEFVERKEGGTAKPQPAAESVGGGFDSMGAEQVPFDEVVPF